MNSIGTFNKASDEYANYRPVYPEDLYRQLIELCPDTDSVWDCGTGNGQSAVALSHHFRHVYATDASPEQIKNAQKMPNIRYAVKNVETERFPDGNFSAICVAQALHWFDLDKFWPIVMSSLKPGGVFAAWGYSWFEIDTKVDFIVVRRILDEIAPYWAPQNRVLWSGYADIEPPFPIVARRDLKIRGKWSLEDMLGYVRTWSATKLRIESGGDRFLDVARAELLPLFGSPTSKLDFAMSLKLILAKRD